MSRDDPELNLDHASAAFKPFGSGQPGGFPWRLIPAALMGLLGALIFLPGFLMLAIPLSEFPAPVREFSPKDRLLISLLIATGSVWIVGGACVWRRSWWIAIPCMVAGLAALFSMGLLFRTP